jgi:catechol 2,3-dioxygenase-like lactoylglutathione lyase family enzyme
MLNKIHKIAVITDDVEGAVEFYTQTMGLKVSERLPNENDEDFVFMVDRDGFILELMPQKTMDAPLGFHHISFKEEDIYQTAEAMKAKGMAFAVEPQSAGVAGIHLGFLNGPNDVLLQLFHRKQ